MESIHREVALANVSAEVRRLASHRDANFISIESYLSWMPEAELLQIFRAVGSLPRLRQLRISFSFQRFRQLPVLPIPCQALVSVLDSALQLETLILDEVSLGHRDGDDLKALSSALQQRAPTLKCVTLFNCFPVESPVISLASTNPQRDEYTANCLDALAQALASVPSLEELNLVFTREGPAWIWALLKQCCYSSSMKRLRINVPDGSFLGDPLKCMCRALETNSTLRELSIRCPLDADGGVALATALKSPSNKIEQLYIQLKSYDFAIPIAEALQHNNRRLKSFELRVWTGGDRGPLMAAFETMVQRNPIIQELIVDNGRLGMPPLINFYLDLNMNGRRHLLESGDKLANKKWIDFLIPFHADSNLSALFYTLSLNPTLCQSQEQRAACVGFQVAEASGNGDRGRRKRQRLRD